MKRVIPGLLIATFVASIPQGAAHAQLVIEDTLTGPSSAYDWRALNGACLTAGNNAGSIPACVGLPYYNGSTQVGGVSGRLPDPAGRGALRLTNGDTRYQGANSIFKTGAVVSNFSFPTNRGLSVSFTSATYGGDGLDGHGADGMSFFLMDGSRPANVGASGGSLGYACKNEFILFTGTGFDAVRGNPDDVPARYDGVDSGYIGIGIDEYGNFSNPVDNTDTGPGFKAGRITMRGAGNTTWANLNNRWPLYYPSTLSQSQRAEAVRNTCATGVLWNYSPVSVVDATGVLVPTRSPTRVRLGHNYPHLASSDLPAGFTIENQQAVWMPTRGAARPITYALNLTQDGILDVSYSINGGTAQPVLTNRRITDSNGPLPGSFRFGFAGSTGGGSNVHEIMCFKAAPLDEASSSAGTNVQPTARVRAGSQVYLAYNHPLNWWGQLKAHDLVEDANDAISISPAANWDAHCTLTGGSCSAMGAPAPSISAQAPASRNILSWNGTVGVPLRWASLTAAQRAQLTAGDATATSARVDYLRGDRSQEVGRGGPFRTRTGVLGDMQHSSPTWVGPPASPYEGPWADALASTAVAAENGGQSYAAFRATYQNRQNLVYVGANDGLLHAFRTGAIDANGSFTPSAATPNDGREALAYMPAAVLERIHSTTGSLDFSDPRYAHNLYVDATPGAGDLYYAGAWHTWLVGGLGPARNGNGVIADLTTTATGALYALDITDPARFGEANAASLVRGEWSSGTISCVNAASCGSHLGSVSGIPAIRRLHNGQWAVLFGNGLNSAAGTAGLFVMLVNPGDGAVSFRYLDTGVGPSGDPLGRGAKNGIVSVTPADLDGDHITDHVYAGDVFGNLWRFDLTSADPAVWTAGAAPMFRTVAGQPITGRVTVASLAGQGTSMPRLIVSFGTGMQLPQSLTAAASYATGTQALYGIWDWNLSGWNAKSGAAARYESLASAPVLAVADLQAQAITETKAPYRSVSNNAICWKGSTSCGDGTRFGWTLALPGKGEQSIYNPILAYGMFVVNTTIPAVSNPTTCEEKPASGYTMAVAVSSGGAAPRPFFPDEVGSGASVAGIALNATGSPSVVTTRKKSFLVQQTARGTGSVTRIAPPPAGPGGRVNWIQLR